MAKFRQKPSSRRQAAPTAKWLVLGLSEARLVAHGQRTTHLTLVKPSHHRKRFLAGQRLSVKAYVGGPTECHVVVSDAQRIQLGQVDYSLVRELGYIRLDSFQESWVAEHETTWRAGETVPEADLLERFQRRHAHRWVWVIRFAVDRTAAPRLLAQIGGRDSGRLVTGKDGRQHYTERRREEETDADHGYTNVPALAVPGQPDALTDDEHERIIARPALVREVRRQAMLAATRAALSTEQRVTAARRAAASKGLDMRSEFRLYDRHVRLERVVEALRQLELIESRVFPQRRAA
jgi:hypothetical protein